MIKFWVYDFPYLLKIEHKHVWWKFFVKNPNEKCNHSKVYVWKVPGVSLPVRQFIWVSFPPTSVNSDWWSWFYRAFCDTPPPGPSDQTFGRSILINYDCNISRHFLFTTNFPLILLLLKSAYIWTVWRFGNMISFIHYGLQMISISLMKYAWYFTFHYV